MIDSLKDIVKTRRPPKANDSAVSRRSAGLGFVNELPVSMLLGNSLVRIGMNGVMVLAMVPSVQSTSG